MVHRRAHIGLLKALSACGRRPPDRAVVVSPVVPLVNGETPLDLVGDGSPSRAVVAWRENGSAHGFSTVLLLWQAPSASGDTARVWQIVPFFDGPADRTAGRELYSTDEGADCTLGDIRLLQRPGTPAEVVMASRALGPSYADPAAVRFDYYRVTWNPDGVVGRPPVYLAYLRSVPAARPYCDVNVAFERELRLGTRGLGQAAAWEVDSGGGGPF